MFEDAYCLIRRICDSPFHKFTEMKRVGTKTITETKGWNKLTESTFFNCPGGTPINTSFLLELILSPIIAPPSTQPQMDIPMLSIEINDWA